MGSNDVSTLCGAFAPINEEWVTDDLAVDGEVPQDLTGLYVRNGPNRRFEAPGRYHWFDGDGMLHAVRFDRGRVQYRNRWVMTDGLADEVKAGHALWQGIKDPPRRDRPDQPLKNTSNTDIKFWNGDLVSMWYLGGAVYRCSPDDLSTRGQLALDPRLNGLPISAHSKVDEQTGELPPAACVSLCGRDVARSLLQLNGTYFDISATGGLTQVIEGKRRWQTSDR